RSKKVRRSLFPKQLPRTNISIARQRVVEKSKRNRGHYSRWKRDCTKCSQLERLRAAAISPIPPRPSQIIRVAGSGADTESGAGSWPTGITGPGKSSPGELPVGLSVG